MTIQPLAALVGGKPAAVIEIDQSDPSREYVWVLWHPDRDGMFEITCVQTTTVRVVPKHPLTTWTPVEAYFCAERWIEEMEEEAS